MKGVIIQARTGSTRLPSKVLLELPFGSGITLLEQIIRRARIAQSLDKIIIATSEAGSDDAIWDLSQKLNVKCFRGNESNVLERYYFCAKKYKLNTIVRLCGDSPFFDGALIDRFIDIHQKNKNDYTGTVHYPLGTNTEIFAFSALKKAYKNATERNDLEHVTPYIRRNPANDFKVYYPEAPEKFNRPDIRLTVDVKEDYALMCSIYDALYITDPLFSLEKIISLFEKKPWLKEINNSVYQKKPFATLEEEIEEIIMIAKKQDLRRAQDFIVEAKNKLL
jgi:spore coat polysaccharide biosynthesis protein SpsF